MSYSENTPMQPFLTSDDSSDYGSDFTPEQEALVDELLATIATENASVTPTPPPQPPADIDTAVADTAPSNISTPAAVAVATQDNVNIQDIEDYYAPQSSPRVPRVLGREKPGIWQLYKTAGPWTKAPSLEPGAPEKKSNDGAAIG